MANVFTLSSPKGGTTFLLWRLEGWEELGRGFEYSVVVQSDDHEVTGDDVLGKGMSVTMGVQMADGSTQDRYIHGIIYSFEQLSGSIAAGSRAVYRLVLRPWFWILSQSGDCRIFQNKTIQDILTDVFKTKNSFTDFEFKLSGTYTTREYCVQYRESDMEFASRIMEEEGIYYYFKHEAAKHTLVVIDDIASHEPLASPTFRFDDDADSFNENETVRRWQHVSILGTTSHSVRDYDFEKPSTLLNSKAQITKTYSLSSFEWYDYPNNFKEVADGNHYAKVWAEERQSMRARVNGEARSYRFSPGYKFTLSEHPIDAENAEHIIVRAELTVRSGEATALAAGTGHECAATFQAALATLPFRAARTTPRPFIPGPQSALVVGKSGEEIWTDKYGRVKVQFYWDRVGEKNENSSCWLRVAQTWAGKNWGGIQIPRIGQEVLVQFMDGNPDRPIVIGRVYNTDQMPPYTLPDNQTQSGVKSRSSKEGTTETFNELRFEDKKGSEEVYFHAEKDFNRVVENNDTLKVGKDGADDGSQTIEVWKNQTVTIGKSASDGSQTIKIYKDETKTIETGNRDVTIGQGNDSLTVSSGNLSIKISSGTCTIEAGTSIELKVGSSSIKIEAAAITIKSADVTVEGTGTAEMKSPSTTVNGSGSLTLKGGMISIN